MRGLRLPQDRGSDGRCLPFPGGVPGVSRVLRLANAQVTGTDRVRDTRVSHGGYRGGVSASQVGGAQTPDSHSDYDYAGERFGLPEYGPRSVATMGRRLVALLIDWLVCLLVAEALFRSHYVQYWTLAIFAVQDYLLTSLTGLTLGKRLAGIRVARLDSRPVFLWGLVRTLLLLTVVAPLVTDRDMRGLHDRAAGTVVIRL